MKFALSSSMRIHKKPSNHYLGIFNLTVKFSRTGYFQIPVRDTSTFLNEHFYSGLQIQSLYLSPSLPV